jgi:hypothetical protein
VLVAATGWGLSATHPPDDTSQAFDLLIFPLLLFTIKQTCFILLPDELFRTRHSYTFDDSTVYRFQ